MIEISLAISVLQFLVYSENKTSICRWCSTTHCYWLRTVIIIALSHMMETGNRAPSSLQLLSLFISLEPLGGRDESEA